MSVAPALRALRVNAVELLRQPGATRDIEVVLGVTATGGTATISLDGKPADSFDLDGITPTDLNAATLQIGARFAFAPRDSKFEFDNVVMDVH